MNNKDAPKDEQLVKGPNIDQLVELAKQAPKRIYKDGPMTILEFENGQILPLYNGGLEITNYKEPCCSFCNKKQSEVKLLISPPDRDDPLICPKCATTFVELFAQKGIEIELNITSIAPNLAQLLRQSAKSDARAKNLETLED